MNTRNQSSVGPRWYEVLLALLPGLALVAQRSGMLHPLGGPPILFGIDLAALVLCLALVLVSLLRERRLAVWSCPALGMVLAAGLVTVVRGIFALTLSPSWISQLAPFLLSAAIWYFILRLAAHSHLGTMAPRGAWLLFALLIGVSVLQYRVDLPSRYGVLYLIIIAGQGAVWLGVSLLPALIALRWGRADGMMAALVVLSAEYVVFNSLLDPSTTIARSTRDPTLVGLAGVLPAIGFLVIAPLWTMTTRSLLSQVTGFLLPHSLALALTAILIGSVSPDYTPASSLGRGLGASEFMLILALAIVLYHGIQKSGARVESELHTVQEAT